MLKGQRLDRRPHNEKFWAFADTTSTCWLWRGANNERYGVYRMGRMMLAHRAAWTITHGPIPTGLQVLHSCDEPLCVNPIHLSLGTQRDNVQDMLTKKRGRWDVRNQRVA